MGKCSNCNRKTTNPKFCSKSCAAIINNKIPKRIKVNYYCSKCGKEVAYQRKFCRTCRPNYIDWTKVKYKDIKGKRLYQKHSRIRGLARRLYEKSGFPMKCSCGYHKHVEICHIKPIAQFHPNTPISVINDINNLIALCPNCHWEFDNGLLNVPARNRT